jgi:hypothetical protein
MRRPQRAKRKRVGVKYKTHFTHGGRFISKDGSRFRDWSAGFSWCGGQTYLSTVDTNDVTCGGCRRVMKKWDLETVP